MSDLVGLEELVPGKRLRLVFWSLRQWGGDGLQPKAVTA